MVSFGSVVNAVGDVASALLGATSPPPNGLPFTQVAPSVGAQINRNIITWFVPQYGTVQMFINPQNITYNHKKKITSERTKGGFTLQYWGEELDILNISGTTGSSGIEGINMLYEIYRAEQYAFDTVGITLAANNAAADVSNGLSQGIGGALGQTIGQTNLSAPSAGGLLGGILGLDSPNTMLSLNNIPTLSALAFSVQMFYNGWAYQGYFNNMTVTEKADNFLLEYSMEFVVTQRSGYRTNYFPWHNSPVGGASNYNTPGSFNGDATVPQPPSSGLGDLLLSLL